MKSSCLATPFLHGGGNRSVSGTWSLRQNHSLLSYRRNNVVYCDQESQLALKWFKDEITSRKADVGSNPWPFVADGTFGDCTFTPEADVINLGNIFCDDFLLRLEFVRARLTSSTPLSRSGRNIQSRWHRVSQSPTRFDFRSICFLPQFCAKTFSVRPRITTPGIC